MSWWIWLLIIFGSLVLIILLIKFLTRRNGEIEIPSNSGSFFDKVKDACCEVLGRK